MSHSKKQESVTPYTGKKKKKEATSKLKTCTSKNIVGHPTGVAENCLVWGRKTTYASSVKSFVSVIVV